MKIFISWSGERSKMIARSLREWLPLVLHYIEPWHSDSDIEAGERWEQSVAKELSSSNFGIICVTSENINSEWMLFEAGALAKSLETSRVIPLLLDLDFKDISGPLAQFQAKKLSQAGVAEIVKSIQQIADNPISESRVTQLFEALWPQVEEELDSIPQVTSPIRSKRSQNEILEELVSSVRSLDSRIKDLEFSKSKISSDNRSQSRSVNYLLRILAEQIRNDKITLSTIDRFASKLLSYDIRVSESFQKIYHDSVNNHKPMKAVLGEVAELLKILLFKDSFISYYKVDSKTFRQVENIIYDFDFSHIVENRDSENKSTRKPLKESDKEDDVDETS